MRSGGEHALQTPPQVRRDMSEFRYLELFYGVETDGGQPLLYAAEQ
jgi:hypothetical protein